MRKHREFAHTILKSWAVYISEHGNTSSDEAENAFMVIIKSFQRPLKTIENEYSISAAEPQTFKQALNLIRQILAKEGVTPLAFKTRIAGLTLTASFLIGHPDAPLHPNSYQSSQYFQYVSRIRATRLTELKVLIDILEATLLAG